MKKHIILLALLIMAVSFFAMSSYPGNYPSGSGGDADQDSNPRLKMKINVWENCSGIFVQVVSDGTLGDGKGIPGANIDVIALPRDNILMLAEGVTDDFGLFTFNTSSKNFSISASKDGYYSEQKEFAPKGVSCPKPELTLDIAYDCAKKGANVKVLSEGESLERAQVKVNGNDAGLTGPDGSLFVPFSVKSLVSASFGDQSAEMEFTPNCPEENKTENKTETVPPLPPPQTNKSPPAPSTDLPFIAGLVILIIALIYILTRGGGKQIGPGPMKKGKAEIGPGPMKPNEIGPGPMKGGKGQIGPGPMKPKEIGPGPM